MFILNINGLYLITQRASVQYFFIKFNICRPCTYGFINIYSLLLVVSINRNSAPTSRIHPNNFNEVQYTPLERTCSN